MDSPINYMGGKSQSAAKIVSLIPEHRCYVECVHPDSYIDIDNGLLKRANEIKEGDLVLTHNGNYKKVSKIFKREYKGDLFVIYSKYTSKPLIVTPEHPILTYQRSKYQCKWRNFFPRFTSYHKSCPYNIPYCGKTKKLQFIEAKDIKINDYVLYSIPKKYDNIIDSKQNKNQRTLRDLFGMDENTDKPITSDKLESTHYYFLNDDFLELCGFYLAEGGIYERRFVHFSFNVNEKEYIDSVIKTMKKYFNCNYDFHNKEGTNGVFIRFYSADACRFFDFFFGHGARNKFIHRMVMELPVLKLTNLIKTYLYGDGCFNENKSLITVASVSFNLINQTKIILNRLGMLVSYTYLTPEEINERNTKYSKDESKILYGKNVKSNYGAHILNIWGANQCNRLFKLLNVNRKYGETKEWFYGELDPNYMYMPVVEIEKIKYDGEVYNFEIEDDNSYVSNGFIVHNCFFGGGWVFFRKPPSKIETINDINGELINLYRTLQRNCEEFKRREKYEMYSRELYYEYLNDYYSGKHKKMDDVERAFRFFCLIKEAFGAKFGGGWGYGAARSSATAFFGEFKMLDEVTKRLKNAQIDNRDFEDVIKGHDTEETIYFCDPPYLKSDNDKYYFKMVDASFTLYDHQRLYTVLKSIKGKFILTIDDDEWVRERYTPDEFTILNNEVFYCSSDGENRRHVNELIIMNFDPNKMKKPIDTNQKSLDSW